MSDRNCSFEIRGDEIWMEPEYDMFDEQGDAFRPAPVMVAKIVDPEGAKTLVSYAEKFDPWAGSD